MYKTWNRAGRLFAVLPLLCAAGAWSAKAQQSEDQPSAAAAKQKSGQDPLFLTATNGTNNFLAVVNVRTKQTDYVPTGGFGGVGGNSGGIAVEGKLAAVVKFNSTNVTIFVRRGNALQPTQLIKTASKPVSVAFGHNHLLVLGATTAESFPVYGTTVTSENDGMAQLLNGDGSSAQILSYDGGAVYIEKSGAIGLLNLATNGFGGLSGPSRPVQLPAAPNNDTPFGTAARGANIYASIAHSNLQTLIVNGQIVSTAAGPTPFKDGSKFLHAPCWNALWGHFLYSADSPGKQIYRYLVSDANVFFDKPGLAKFSGSPTDITTSGDLLGVIDGGDGATSNASVFDIDSEGELTLRFSVKIAGAVNGAAII